jgi:flagellin
MTSILTNAAAMSALQTLRSINNGMDDTQARVSSGLRVGSASDNAAYWSIATTMRSDNMALSAVQDALGLGAAKVDTAYSGMNAAIDVVKEIKKKLVTATEDGIDKAKVQEEIAQLQDQLKGITDAASFSGENWLKADAGANSGAGEAKNVVGSFVRDDNGNVSVKKIGYTLDSSTVLFDSTNDTPATTYGQGILDSEAVYTNGGVEVDFFVNGVKDSQIVAAESTKKLMEDGFTFTTNTDGQTTATDSTDYYLRVNEDQWVKLVASESVTDQAVSVDIGGTQYYVDVSTAASGSTKSSGFSVYNLDITALTAVSGAISGTETDALNFMIQHVDDQLQTMTSAAAQLGSVSSRIELQEEFASKLSSAIDKGVGRLVDADMNEESTRLKALQTQQQLAIQSLSIANSASQNILSLFR